VDSNQGPTFVLRGEATHVTRYTEVRGSSRRGSVTQVSEQRAHSVGSAAAAAGVAPLTRVLSGTISSTMCAASAKTAAV
jgi:hypothetical protein